MFWRLDQWILFHLVHGIELGALILPKVIEKGAGTSQKNAKKNTLKCFPEKMLPYVLLLFLWHVQKSALLRQILSLPILSEKKSVKKCLL